MAEMTWTLMPPPGTAFYLWHDGTLRMRFNETQVEDVVKWAKDWTRLFVQYARAHKASPTDAIKVHPKTWEEIQEVVRNLNIGIETQKEQLKLMQCSECLGIEKDEGEPPCPKCQGTGFVDVT